MSVGSRPSEHLFPLLVRLANAGGRQPWRLAGALWSCALRHGSQESEPDRKIAHPAEPDPFLYGVPRAHGQPEAADEILLHGGLDGAQRQERRSHQPDTLFRDTLVVPARHVAYDMTCP